jgi:hypothetical protein
MQSRSHDGLVELTMDDALSADSFRYLTPVFAAVDRLIPNVVRTTRSALRLCSRSAEVFSFLLSTKLLVSSPLVL